MLAGALLSLAVTAGEGGGVSEARWRWYVACDSPSSTRVLVTFENTPVLDATVPVCRVAEARRNPEAERRVLEFSFRANPAQFDDQAPFAPGSNIVGNVWQAGGEPDGIVFGVSLQTNGRILLNTLHIAGAGQRSRESLAQGLVVTTTRFRGKRP